MDTDMTEYDKTFIEAQEAFENHSSFYFCGESPCERIVYWHVWLESWMMAREITC